MRSYLAGWALVLLAACSNSSGDNPSVDSPSSSTGTDPAAKDTPGAITPADNASSDGNLAQRCVDGINAYRKTLDLPPLARWTDAEACADGQAASDAASNKPHGAFGNCGEMAQNECPSWPSKEAVVTGCLAQMWAEGPGSDFSKHGHYLNMSSTKYSKVACGFFTTAKGGVWSVQDFR